MTGCVRGRNRDGVMSTTLDHISVYPVKGLSGQTLDSTTLTAGQGVPWDRRFAITHGAGSFDPVNPEWVGKFNFLMYARNPKLAELRSHFDPETQILTLKRDGRQVARGALNQQIGLDLISQFLSAFMKDAAKGKAKLVQADGIMFSDVPDPWVSIINLDTVEELGTVSRQSIDPRRFRGNLMIRGLKPWAELSMVGQEVAIGDGGARLRIVEPTGRCAATTVNPDTGERDVMTLQILERNHGHTKCGVYAEVIGTGPINAGDTISFSG